MSLATFQSLWPCWGGCLRLQLIKNSELLRWGTFAFRSSIFILQQSVCLWVVVTFVVLHTSNRCSRPLSCVGAFTTANINGIIKERMTQPYSCSHHCISEWRHRDAMNGCIIMLSWNISSFLIVRSCFPGMCYRSALHNALTTIWAMAHVDARKILTLCLLPFAGSGHWVQCWWACCSGLSPHRGQVRIGIKLKLWIHPGFLEASTADTRGHHHAGARSSAQSTGCAKGVGQRMVQDWPVAAECTLHAWLFRKFANIAAFANSLCSECVCLVSV